MGTKIIFILIGLLLFPSVAGAALSFTNGSEHHVNYGSASSLDNLAALTILAWVYPTSSNEGQIAGKLDTGGGNGPTFYKVGTTNYLNFTRYRATTALAAVSSSNALSTNAWNFVGAAIDTAGANGDQDLYVGSPTSSVVEVSTYSTQAVGSGGLKDDSAINFGVGDIVGVNWFTFPGRIAWIGVWNRKLTLGEIKDQQFNPHKTSGNVLFTHLGFNGTGTQADWSGNGNSGTVTGATIAPHVPLRAPFGGGSDDGQYALNLRTKFNNFFATTWRAIRGWFG